MSKNLRSVSLKFEYRSNEDDLVNGFYIPCLSESVRYDRAVGFFTAQGLSLAARGLAELVKAGGKMRLIVGAIISEDDKDQILRGYEDRLKQNLESNFEKELSSLQDETIIKRMTSIAWLISSDRLEVKVAIRVDEEDRIKRGIYHEKMGVFYDELGNNVAFGGSSNETVGGLIDNFESVPVYVSWVPSEKQRIERKIFDFEEMWRDETRNLHVLDFTEAVKKNVLRFRGDTIPEFDPEDKRLGRSEASGVLARHPLDFQLRAIERWEENEFHGILAMATGSGKTYTALMAVKDHLSPNVLVVIVVPGIEIAEQWEKEIHEEFGEVRVVQCNATAGDWYRRLTEVVNYIATAAINELGRTFVISTYDSASSTRFLQLIQNVPPERLCLICDEVHHAGSPVQRKTLEINAKYRLGLSATPKRNWDELGTDLIMQYFGGQIYSYSIEQAIEQKRLCPYDYHVHAISLDSNELSEFREISTRIAKLVAMLLKGHPQFANLPTSQAIRALLASGTGRTTELQTLLIQRANIGKRAIGKLVKLKEIIESYPVNRCLVYCNDQEQVNDISRLLIENGLIAAQYTSMMSNEERITTLKSFEEGHSELLVAIRCLDEGVNLPICDTAIVVASSKSEREFIQRRGRILRLHPSKTKATIHDMIVLPFTDLKKSFPLNDTELSLVDSELERAEIFAENATNKEEIQREIDDLRYLVGRAVRS